MPDEAQRYLLPPHDTFWTWKDEGEVIAWADDTTIAFRQELLYVLQKLAPEGLPPLGAVILLMAATRDQWSAISLEPGILAGMLRTLEHGDAHNPLLATVLAGLDRVFYLEDRADFPADRDAIIESNAARLVNEDTQGHAATFLLVLKVNQLVTEIIEDRFDQCFNLCLDLLTHLFSETKKSEPRSSLFS